MGTSALVCLEQKDKKIKYLYVSRDGYPSDGGVGDTILENYNDFNKIEKLLSLNEVSSIKNSFEQTIEEKYDDVDEDGNYIFEDIDEAIKKNYGDYLYLFKDNQWLCFWYFEKGKQKWISLLDAIEFDQDEDIENNKKYIEYLNSFPKEKKKKFINKINSNDLKDFHIYSDNTKKVLLIGKSFIHNVKSIDDINKLKIELDNFYKYSMDLLEKISKENEE